MKFSKEPYKIATNTKKSTKVVMVDTVGMVLKDTGIAYRKQDQRGRYILDHLASGYYITTLEGSETFAKRMCCELAKVMDFNKSRKELSTKENKIIVKTLIAKMKGNTQ